MFTLSGRGATASGLVYFNNAIGAAGATITCTRTLTLDIHLRQTLIGFSAVNASVPCTISALAIDGVLVPPLVVVHQQDTGTGKYFSTGMYLIEPGRDYTTPGNRVLTYVKDTNTLVAMMAWTTSSSGSGKGNYVLTTGSGSSAVEAARLQLGEKGGSFFAAAAGPYHTLSALTSSTTFEVMSRMDGGAHLVVYSQKSSDITAGTEFEGQYVTCAVFCSIGR